MFPAKNSSNLRHEVFNNWLDSTKSTWKVLKENNRLIRGSLIYLSVSNPRNWLIKVTIHWVSSLKMFTSTWNGRFCSWTYCLKQLLKNSCFLCIADSLKYCTRLFTIFFRLQGELIRDWQGFSNNQRTTMENDFGASNIHYHSFRKGIIVSTPINKCWAVQGLVSSDKVEVRLVNVMNIGSLVLKQFKLLLDSINRAIE